MTIGGKLVHVLLLVLNNSTQCKEPEQVGMQFAMCSIQPFVPVNGEFGRLLSPKPPVEIALTSVVLIPNADEISTDFTEAPFFHGCEIFNMCTQLQFFVLSARLT